MESRELNTVVLLIDYMKQHKYSYGGLITKILLANGVDLTEVEQVEGKVILEKNFQKLTFNEKWDEGKAQEQRRLKQEKRRARKARGTVEKDPVVKKARNIKPKAQKKFDVD